MGLMQLLTVGRSLSEAKDQPHRYKLRTGNWPTFGHGPAVRRASGKKFDGEEEGEMKTEAEAEKAARAHVAFPRGRWTQSQAAAPVPTGKAGTQGELSLDRVRPVRNDLSDTDLELIPRQEKPEAKEAPKVSETANIFAAAPTPPAAKKVSWLARVTSRLFGRKTG